MIKQIRLEIRNCINTMTFKLSFGLLMLCSLGAYLTLASGDKGMSFLFIRSRYDNFILRSPSITEIANVIVVFFTLLSFIGYAGSYRREEKMGISRAIMTRSNKRIYFYGKAAAIFIVTFFMFFIPLLVNQVLNCITYPVIGFDNNYAGVTYDLTTSYQEGWAFDFLKIQWPWLYNFIYILIYSITGGIFALFIYGLTLLRSLRKCPFYVITATAFVLFMAAASIGENIGHGEISYLALIQAENPAGEMSMMIFLMLFLISALIMIFRGVRTYEESI